MKFLLLICTIIGATKLTQAQPGYVSLPWSQNLAYNSYLLRTTHAQYQDRSLHLHKAMQSKSSLMAYRDAVRKSYQTILGPMPDRSELHAQILHSSQYQNFKIETIIYQSIPGRYVTANLYLPPGPGPHPASLELCGHGINGKTGTAAAILMARHGIAVLIVDPIGQGERIQLLDPDGKTMTRGATTEHTLLNAGCNLLGSSLAAYEYWDNSRALNYLESRSDIDKNRLGVYGSSGGGTQTAYLIGLEDRLKVASICSYFSQRERVLELSGASDGCQHVPGEGKAGIEIADWVTMFAPKPVLVMSGRYDFVDYWGAVQGSNELTQVYAAMGAKDRFRLLSTEGGHGMPREKREALVTWFRTWLVGDPTTVVEQEVIKVRPEDTQCTASGQVLTQYKEAVSIPIYNGRVAASWADNRALFMRQSREQIRQKIYELLGTQPPMEKMVASMTGTGQFRGMTMYKYQLLRPGEMPVPCVVAWPSKVSSNARVILILDDRGKDSFWLEASRAQAILDAGDILVTADLRGKGETEDPAELNDRKYFNREYRNAMISLHIGRSIVGQRVTDMYSLVDFISTEERLKNHAISVEAYGSYSSVALHAAYLDPRIAHTTVVHGLTSYMDFIEHPIQWDMYTQVIPGVLKYYDLKDLMEKLGAERVKLVE